MIDSRRFAKSLRAYANTEVLRTAAVDREERERALFAIVHARYVNIRHVVGHVGIATWALNGQVE